MIKKDICVDMLDKIRRLIELSAGEFEYIDLAMIARLDGTRCMLKAWGAREALQQAGLFHQAYCKGQVYDRQLLSQHQRQLIAEVIGQESENIVYHYCACDREHFFNSLMQDAVPMYIDRFTQSQTCLAPQLLNDLCEIFVATELESLLNTPANTAVTARHPRQLFSCLAPYLSRGANNKLTQLLVRP